jgi:RNA polymerase sigma-70 factor (ECF subfamily)
VTDPDFDELVREHYAALFRFALSLAGSEAEAADLTQQTFYRWATRSHQLRDQSRRKTWLFTTLYREFLGGRRREARFPHFELSAVDNELPVIEPRGIAELDGALVMRALREVDEVFRAPLALFYLEDRSYKEIAETLGVPAGTVMSRLARGKQQLREILERATRPAADKIIPLSDPLRSGRAQS